MGYDPTIDRMAIAFKSGVNARIAQFSVLVKDTTDTTQNRQYATLPGGPNAPGVLGVTIDPFVEPDYFVRPGTDPTTVTGTPPSQFNLTGRAITLKVMGVAKAYAAGAVNQGDLLVIADIYGRVNNAANLGIPSGTKLYPVGVAQTTTREVNQIVKVLLGFGQAVA